MIKYFLLLACLTGGTLAQDGGIDTQTQLYIVAGILGGACLLLTIASIYNSVTIIGLQSKLAVLQAAGSATVKAISNVAENTPKMPKKFQDPEASDNYPQNRDPYAARNDPYRRPEPRGDYRMERMNPYYDDYRNSRPHGMQPSRPYHDDRRPGPNYY
ncbi:uncharacterized protein [Palaemon carinicauda]|uniref:uncharacterized protein isoform X1 n=1 Tax=Palaemon carinicauda TaxID=392227 RepID=UPI0035B5D919